MGVITVWTGERRDKLREMIAAGSKHADIAGYFGLSVNAIKIAATRFSKGWQKDTHAPSKLETAKKALSATDIATRLRVLQGLEIRQDRPKQIFSDQQLQAWISNYEMFIKEICNVELQDYQRKMLDLLRNKKRVCFVMGRKSSKSFMVSLFSIAQSIINPNQHIIIIAPSLRQSKITFDIIHSFILQSDPLYYSVKESKSGNEFYLKFTNNSVIRALPAGDDASTIRGFDITHAIVEEAAHGVCEEAYPVVYGMLAISNGSLFLVSTPAGTNGKLWEAFNSGLWSVMQLPSWCNKYVSKEWLESMKAELGSVAYDSEICANFNSALNNFFPLETIQRCTEKYDMSRFSQEHKVYSAGLDIGRFHDYSVLVICSRLPTGEIRTEFIDTMAGVPFREQVARIVALHKEFNFRLVAEYTGLGMPVCEDLREAGIPTEFFVPTATNKQEAFNYLLKQMENGKLIIPEHSQLQFELRNFKMEFGESGVMKLHGVQDDHVHALCYAIRSLRSVGRPFVIY